MAKRQRFIKPKEKQWSAVNNLSCCITRSHAFTYHERKKYEGFGGRPPVGMRPGARAPLAPLKSSPDYAEHSHIQSLLAPRPLCQGVFTGLQGATPVSWVCVICGFVSYRKSSLCLWHGRVYHTQCPADWAWCSASRGSVCVIWWL